VVLFGEKKPYLWEVSNALAMEIRGFGEQMDTLTDLKLHVSRDAGGSKARLRIDCRGIDEYHSSVGVVFAEPFEALQLTWALVGEMSEVLSRESIEKSEY
jgi:hypothetical protein